MRSSNSVIPGSRLPAVLCGAWLLASWLAGPAASADLLVTRDGERIETRGPWEVRGRLVVFTRGDGTLASVRLAELDLDASRAASAAAAAPKPPPPAAGPVAKPPVLVLTTADVGVGVPGAEGADLLVERLRLAHRYGDVGLAKGLFNWEGVPQSMRGDIESQLEWMMERRIRSIRFVAADPEAGPVEVVRDDVAYEPNVEVAGRIEIDFVPDPDQAEVSLTFHVGTRLGQYFLAGPRVAEN